VTKIPTSNFSHLEDIFFKPPLPDSLPTVAFADDKEVELDIGLHAKFASLFFLLNLYYSLYL